MPRYHRHLFPVLLILLSLLVLHPAGIQAQADETAAVRFVHVVPGVGAIDVYIDENLTVAGLESGAATTYLDVPAGTLNLRVTLAGLTTTLWEQPLSIPGGDLYTLVASSTDPLNFSSFRDDPTTLAVGTARVMIVHALAGGPAVDFQVNGDLIVENLEYGGFINSIDVPANVYQMAFLPNGDDTTDPLIPETPVSLTSLTNQMLVLYGTPASPQILTLTTPTDANGEAGLVRFAHGVADAGAVNIALDGTLLVPSLTYGAFTGHLAIPAGTYNVTIQDVASDAELAAASLTVTAGQAQTIVALAGLGGAAAGVFIDDVSGVASRQAVVSVVNTTDATATLTLDGNTPLASELAAGAASEPVSLTPVDGRISVELSGGSGDPITAEVPGLFYGGVYYNLFVLADGTVSVAPTSLGQAVGSAPGGQDVVAVPPTVEATAVPTEVAQTAPTTEATTAPATQEAPAAQPTAVVVPTAASPTARIVLDPGVNLQLREYPSADAKSLGLAPSGTILTVNGRVGAPADIDGNEITLPDGTDFVDPATLLTDEDDDLTPVDTWLNVTYDTPDGGQIIAWVNAQYLDVNDPKGLNQRLADLPTVPQNRPGEAVNTAITPPVAQAEFVEAIVTQLDTGVNLNIRRTPQSDSEILARVASGTALELIGFGASDEWAFVRYRPVEGGAITGWASLLYLRFEFRDAAIDRVEMEERGLLTEVDEATLRGEVSRDAPALTMPTPNPLRDIVVATVVELNEGIRLNLRRTPTVDGEVLANLLPGTQVPVYSQSLNGEWLEAEFEGVRGWISVQYVTLSYNNLSVSIDDVPLNQDQVAAATGTPTATPTP